MAGRAQRQSNHQWRQPGDARCGEAGFPQLRQQGRRASDRDVYAFRRVERRVGVDHTGGRGAPRTPSRREGDLPGDEVRAARALAESRHRPGRPRSSRPAPTSRRTSSASPARGVKVAVMDTGIDYRPSRTSAAASARAAASTQGCDFVGDAYNADDARRLQPGPDPDADPDDCAGHGTHVAGIVGANGGVKGVAPGVTFGAYRVFGCEGSTTPTSCSPPWSASLADGADVLNMSIGAALPVAAVPDRAGRRPARQQGHRRRRVDRQRAAPRPLRGRRARRRQEGDRRRVVRQHPRQRCRVHDLARQRARSATSPATGAPPPPTSRHLPDGAHRHDDSTADGCMQHCPPAA